MRQPDQDQAVCKVLFVSEVNLLDDSVEASGQRELLRSLSALGLSCEAVTRFLVAADEETEPGPWLAEQGWALDQAPFEELGASALAVTDKDVSITLLRGPSTRPHAPDDAEQAAFVRLVRAVIDRRRPDVVVVRSGPSLAAVLAIVRARHLATVALEPDCTVRSAEPYRDADVVLTPARFAADYLRDAFALPCVSLPPVIARQPVAPSSPGSLVFDASSPANGLAVFVQLAAEIARRRPNVPIVALGGHGALTIADVANVKLLPASALDKVWASAHVFLAPLVAWEALPLAPLAALSHGVPVVASDRGALPELLDRAGLLLPLPQRLTTTNRGPLQPAELAPWIDAILRLYDDFAFASNQRNLALLAGQRWAPETVAPEYARLFTNLAGHHKHRPGRNGHVAHRNGSDVALRRLAEASPWPAERPNDAAPGEEQGWLGAGTETMLANVLSPSTELVVELGAWLGLSTRYIAQYAPAATVISVDHWQGSPEHQAQERFRKLLPQLFETYQARCWDYRERVVPLRMTTLDGLLKVAEHGLHPDFVYVDAEHSYDAVTAELSLARQLFPRAVLGGDDYDWRGVREGVDSFARRHGLVVDRFGARGWRLLEKWEAGEATRLPPSRGQSFVLVPHMNGIEGECEQALRALESAGVRVVRRGGCSAIDVARNEMVSDALHNEAEAILFIDSDIGFEPQDALRLLARPEPVVCGVYAKKGMRELASVFAPGTKEVVFGPEVVGAYPLDYAATGFLRMRAGMLRRMIAELHLPLCNTHWGRGVWPFFQPMIVPHGEGKLHYLGEDWAFSYRLKQIGVTPLADTSIRLWHWGRYAFSWEDAGSTVNRYRSYSYRLS
jgi:hypothetical protein